MGLELSHILVVWRQEKDRKTKGHEKRKGPLILGSRFESEASMQMTKSKLPIDTTVLFPKPSQIRLKTMDALCLNT